MRVGANFVFKISYSTHVVAEQTGLLCKFYDISTTMKMSRTQQKSHSFHIQEKLAVALLALSSSVRSDQQCYLPIDCDDIHCHDNNTSSGVYTIYPGGLQRL